MKLTAILLSYKRPRNLERIVDTLSSHPRIGEIIVWNNNPDVELKLPQATVIQAGRNFLCIARYGVALLAKHEHILFQDDDFLIPHHSLDALLAEYARDPSRIYGHRGRDLFEGKYQGANRYGECDIVLGQLMVFSKALLAQHYGQILRLTPFERGDDIAFSLLAGRKHLAMKIEVEDLGSTDEVSLWKAGGHWEKRQQMVDRILEMRRREQGWLARMMPAGWRGASAGSSAATAPEAADSRVSDETRVG